jgi:hypothetical protein
VSIEELLNKGGIRRGFPASERRREPWGLASLTGEFVDVAGVGGLTIVAELVRETQALGAPVVWASLADELVYGPDLVMVGVDVSALPIVTSDKWQSLLGAVEVAVRSGAFRLVVLDCGNHRDTWTEGTQVRLARQARAKGATLVRLTQECLRSRCRLAGVSADCRIMNEGSGLLCCEMTVRRRHGRSVIVREVWHGPDGLCLDS